MREEFNPQGRLTLTLRDPCTGRVVDRRVADNLVTLAGRQLLSGLFSGTITVLDAVEVVVGDGGIPGAGPGTPVAPALDDEELRHSGEEPLAATAEIGDPFSRGEGSAMRMVTPVLATFEANPGSPPLYLREAGIRFTLPAPDEPVLYNRVTFGLITKDPNLQLSLSWEVIF